MNDILKPCPFCGEKAKIEVHDNHHQISCSNLNCVAYDLYNEVSYPKTRNLAIEAWNARHESSEIEGLKYKLFLSNEAIEFLDH